MSCPGETNITEKEEEKIRKYAELTYEIKKTYQMEVKFIPLIIGVLGGMRPNFVDHLRKISKIEDKHIEALTIQMQKHVILGSLNVLRSHEAGHPPT